MPRAAAATRAYWVGQLKPVAIPANAFPSNASRSRPCTRPNLDRRQLMPFVDIAARAGQRRVGDAVVVRQRPGQNMFERVVRRNPRSQDKLWVNIVERLAYRRQGDPFPTDRKPAIPGTYAWMNLFVRRISSTHMIADAKVSSPASLAKPKPTAGLSSIEALAETADLLEVFGRYRRPSKLNLRGHRLCRTARARSAGRLRQPVVVGISRCGTAVTACFDFSAEPWHRTRRRHGAAYQP